MSLVEICAGTLNSAIAAVRGGAGRIELCDNLYEGGTTPSPGQMKVARDNVKIPINVLVRPRGGDFCYNDAEFEAMKEDIRACKDLGMNGVVIGILNPDGTIDEDRTRELIDLARPLSVTFHRAFDMTPDPWLAFESVKRTGADRLLTSGQKPSVIDGQALIRELIGAAGDDIIILPGAGLNVDNIEEFHRLTNAKEYHTTCRSAVESKMIFRNTEIAMGGLPQIPEYEILESDPEKVRRFVELVRKSG